MIGEALEATADDLDLVKDLPIPEECVKRLSSELTGVREFIHRAVGAQG